MGEVQVGVDLSRGNISMAQHTLDAAKVGPPLDEVGGKGMPQGMRANLFLDPGFRRQCLEEFPEHLPAHATT